MLAVADHCYCYHHTRDADNAALERDKDRDATRTAVLALTERSPALRRAAPFTPPPSQTRNLYNASFKVYHCVLCEYANDITTVWNFVIPRQTNNARPTRSLDLRKSANSLVACITLNVLGTQ